MFDPHVIAGNWNVNHPVGFVVSDMTIFKKRNKNEEWTLWIDPFNNSAGESSPSRGCFHIDSSAYV